MRECAYLGVPVVNIGNRQFRRIRSGNVVDVGYDQKEIAKAAERAITLDHFAPDFLYGSGNAGKKIADILAETELTFSKTITY